MTPPAAADRVATAALAAFCVGTFLVLSLRSDVFCHGDVGTDGRALIGAEQFRRVGGAALHWTQTVDGRAEIGLRPSYYPRHPNGGVAVLAALRGAGFDVPAARLAPLLATTCGLLGLWLAARRLAGGAAAAAVACAAAAYAPHYLLADSLQFYSYGLFAKGVGLWCAAGVATTTGRARAAFALGATAAAFAGPSLCGLETMPALGLLSFAVPLIAGPGALRARFFGACVAAGATGAGMALGVLVRVLNMAPIFGGSAADALRHLGASAASRSLGGDDGALKGAAYVAEVAERLAAYAPLHLAVAAAGVALAVFMRVRGRTTPPGAAFAVACLAAELPYFALMRRHVSLHVHTLMHLGFAVAAAAALGALALARLAPVGRARRAALVAAAGLAVASVAVAPLEERGNLLARGTRERLKDAAEDSRDALLAAPRDAVVYIAPHARDWQVREAASLLSRTFVASDDLRPPATFADDAAYLGSLTSRPVYALTSAAPEDPHRRRYAARGVPIAANRRHELFAVENLPPAVGLKATWVPFARADLDRARPDAALAALAPDQRRDRVRAIGDDLRLGLGPRPAPEARTTVELPFPAGVADAALFAADVLYAPAGSQPALRLALTAVVAAGAGADAPAAPAAVFDLAPSKDRRPVELHVPPGSRARAVRLTLDAAPGDLRGDAARVVLTSLRVLPRPAATR